MASVTLTVSGQGQLSLAAHVVVSMVECVRVCACVRACVLLLLLLLGPSFPFEVQLESGCELWIESRLHLSLG